MKAFLAVLMAALLYGCGSPASTGSAPGSAAPTPAVATPTPTLAAPTPAVHGAGAATPEDAVRAMLPGPVAGACRPQTPPAFSAAAGCPITDRLEQRLQSNPTSGPGGGADPVCRCQNFAPVTMAPAVTSGSSATVKVTYQFQPPYDETFALVSVNTHWWVDDMWCKDPSSSIYNSPVKPCAV